MPASPASAPLVGATAKPRRQAVLFGALMLTIAATTFGVIAYLADDLPWMRGLFIVVAVLDSLGRGSWRA